jgi:hypothetical protein
VWGVIHVRILFSKEIFYEAQNEIARDIYFKHREKSKQRWPFLISSKVG